MLKMLFKVAHSTFWAGFITELAQGFADVMNKSGGHTFNGLDVLAFGMIIIGFFGMIIISLLTREP